jgi:uncharacterized membrane protein YccF (DUF307 family)
VRWSPSSQCQQRITSHLIQHIKLALIALAPVGMQVVPVRR